jgi:serine-type D-Ala-D-Ala carboxypeptidase (penicillin-binding protein 5/6)
MKKTLLMLILITILSSSNLAFADKLNISNGCSYILMDSKTGQVIAEENADVKLRPASTTKVMTAILALEKGKLDAVMNVSSKAVNDIGRGGMNVGIMPNESNLKLEHLLNITLVKSANDAANIIGENIGGSKEEFVKMMNEKAIQLGAYNTNFINPCGKDDTKADRNHLSTARDMATIARYAMTFPKFREIVSQEWYSDMPQTNVHLSWGRFRTTNRLLWNDDHQYTYKVNGVEHKYTVTGVKTGYTSAAGNNLLCSAIDENGMELVIAVMHVMHGNNNVFNIGKELLEYGFKQYSNQKVVGGNEIIKTVPVENAKNNDNVEIKTKEDFICALPNEQSKWNITSNLKIEPQIKAPISQGQILGQIEYERNGIKLGKVDLVAGKSIEEKTNILSSVTKPGKRINFGLLILLVLVFLSLFFVPKFIKKKMREKNINDV